MIVALLFLKEIYLAVSFCIMTWVYNKLFKSLYSKLKNSILYFNRTKGAGSSTASDNKRYAVLVCTPLSYFQYIKQFEQIDVAAEKTPSKPERH